MLNYWATPAGHHLLFLHSLWREDIYAIKNISERKLFDFLKIRIHVGTHSEVLITLVLFSILKGFSWNVQLRGWPCDPFILYFPFSFSFYSFATGSTVLNSPFSDWSCCKISRYYSLNASHLGSFLLAWPGIQGDPNSIPSHGHH